jgi:hypothetical protein
MKVIIGKAKHEQSRIILKNPLVDKEMADILKWFNSFDVLTLASCQAKSTGMPYVMWVSYDTIHTNRILSVFDFKESTSVRFNTDRNCLVYTTQWPDLDYLQRRVEYYRQNA